MDFMTLSQERYSVRKYSDKPVENEKLQKILEAGRIAPTAANKQPQKIYVLKSSEAMEKAQDFTRMMYNAPMAAKVFELPENIHPVCFLLIGYAADRMEDSEAHTKRRTLTETVVEL